MSSIVKDAFRLEVRETVGGGASRAMRRENMIPGVVYGAGKDNVHLAVDPRDVMKGLNTVGFYAKLYEIKVGKEAERVLVREVQMHPVTDQPIHIDFVRVKKGAKTHVNIPVHFKNDATCPGVKRGGVMNVVLHSLEVTCDVDNIPEEIVIDMAGLNIGDSVHTADIDLPNGAVATHPERDITLVTITAPKGGVSDEDEASEDGGDAAEGDAE